MSRSRESRIVSHKKIRKRYETERGRKRVKVRRGKVIKVEQNNKRTKEKRKGRFEISHGAEEEDGESARASRR